jgi:DnaJ-class molecular chaperone
MNKFSYIERKERRKWYFENFVKGWKLRPCSACGGSGHYDDTNSPKCEACNGTGKERYKNTQK